MPPPRKINETAFKSMGTSKFEGILIEKYLDKKNHNHATLKLENSSGEKSIILTRDKSELFDFVKIGDSIIKEYDNEYVKIVRQEKIYEIRLRFRMIPT